MDLLETQEEKSNASKGFLSLQELRGGFSQNRGAAPQQSLSHLQNRGLSAACCRVSGGPGPAVSCAAGTTLADWGRAGSMKGCEGPRPGRVGGRQPLRAQPLLPPKAMAVSPCNTELAELAAPCHQPLSHSLMALPWSHAGTE